MEKKRSAGVTIFGYFGVIFGIFGVIKELLKQEFSVRTQQLVI